MSNIINLNKNTIGYIKQEIKLGDMYFNLEKLRYMVFDGNQWIDKDDYTPPKNIVLDLDIVY